jgi:hypothetical protein
VSGESERFAVFGFDSTHDALRAEDVLLADGVGVALIPTPRALGSLCGFAIRVAADDRDHGVSVLSGAGITPNAEIEIEDRVVG